MKRSSQASQIIRYIIAVFFIYNTFGYLFLFIPAKVLIKEIVQLSLEDERFEPSEFSFLIFNLNDLKDHKYDFEWEEFNKEFRFNGKMYDVKTSEIKGDSIYLTCYFDHKENILEELFTSHFYNNKKNQAQTSSGRIVLLGVFVEELMTLDQGSQNKISSVFSFGKSMDKIQRLVEEVPTPPPQLLS